MSEQQSLRKILDEDVRIFASLASAIASDYLVQDDDPWVGSPFEWVKRLPSSRQRGAIGEALVAGWAAAKGFDVTRPPTSDCDRVINGKRIEIKMSTIWNTGVYKFQQLRDQEYDFALCVGISPFDVQAWLLPKSILKQYVIGHMGQHTGAAAGDTAWISIPAQSPFPWMEEFGDRLGRVAELLGK